MFRLLWPSLRICHLTGYFGLQRLFSHMIFHGTCYTTPRSLASLLAFSFAFDRLNHSMHLNSDSQAFICHLYHRSSITKDLGTIRHDKFPGLYLYLGQHRRPFLLIHFPLFCGAYSQLFGMSMGQLPFNSIAQPSCVYTSCNLLIQLFPYISRTGCKLAREIWPNMRIPLYSTHFI